MPRQLPGETLMKRILPGTPSGVALGALCWMTGAVSVAVSPPVCLFSDSRRPVWCRSGQLPFAARLVGRLAVFAAWPNPRCTPALLAAPWRRRVCAVASARSHDLREALRRPLGSRRPIRDVLTFRTAAAGDLLPHPDRHRGAVASVGGQRPLSAVRGGRLMYVAPRSPDRIR